MAAKNNPLKNIEIRPGEYSDTYRVRFKFKQKYYTATRDSLPEAIQWRDEAFATLRTGGQLEGDIPDGDMRLGEATDKFISSAADRTQNTINSYIYAQSRVLEFFGEQRLLSQITPTLMCEYIEARRTRDNVGGSKLCQELSFIRMVYETARAFGINLVSPEAGIKRPKKQITSREDKLDRIIKADEMISLLEQTQIHSEDLHLYLIFLLYTGMRPSEAATLRWNRLPLKVEKLERKSRKHIGYVDLPRGGFSRIGTKTETRFVPAHPIALEVIQTLQDKLRGEDKEYVFVPDDHGQRERPYLYFRWKFRQSRIKAILPTSESLREGIDFYSFRHTARSRMAVCGIQDSAAETIIGHADKSMQAVYTHYVDQDLIREITKLEYPWL